VIQTVPLPDCHKAVARGANLFLTLQKLRLVRGHARIPQEKNADYSDLLGFTRIWSDRLGWEGLSAEVSQFEKCGGRGAFFGEHTLSRMVSDTLDDDGSGVGSA
jgi:hypothetical protein